MNSLIKTTKNKEVEAEFSFKSFFVPLTTVKAIHWIVFIGLIVYANMLFNGFVWDDLFFIVQNTQIHTLNLSTIFGQSNFNDPIYGYYRPIPALYYSLLYIFFQNSTFEYHFFQLLFHLGNAVLVFILFNKFLSRNLSFVLSLIFLVHPVQVESVSYISQIDSTLFFLFGLTALLLCMQSNVKTKRIFLIFLLLFLSLLTKETGFLFLIIVLLYKTLYNRKKIKTFILFSAIITLTYFMMRFFLGHIYFAKITYDNPIANLSFTERLINIPMIIFYYLKTSFFPLQLNIDQKWIITNVSLSTFYAPLLIDFLFLMTIILFGGYLYKANRKLFLSYLLFFVWFILGICIVSQIFTLDMTVADRWLYFPIVGLLGMIGVCLQFYLSEHKRRTKLAIYTIIVLVIILLSIRTIERNSNWQNMQTLYSHDTQNYNDYDLSAILGIYYYADQNYQEAIKYLKESTEILPVSSNLFELATAYAQNGNKSEANRYYEDTLNARDFTQTSQTNRLFIYTTYSWFLLYSGSYQSALKIIKGGLTAYPNSSKLWEELAIAEYNLHNQTGALYAIDKARDYSDNTETETAFIKITNHEPIIVLQSQSSSE